MMDFFIKTLNFLWSNSSGITLVSALVVGFWQYWKYTREWNFQNYHKLIKELNQSDTPSEHIKLYRQVAVVYELRHYPRYFSVSKRILNGWLCSRNNPGEEYKDLYDEMKLSVEYMNKNWIKRLF